MKVHSIVEVREREKKLLINYSYEMSKFEFMLEGTLRVVLRIYLPFPSYILREKDGKDVEKFAI
jgi:hypothetical protein